MAAALKATLFSLELSLLLYIVCMVCALVAQGHKKRSFTAFFFSLCFVWNLLRSVFWLSTLGAITLPLSWTVTLWWLPVPTQFAVFSLLLLFYAKVLMLMDWRHRWAVRLVAAYVVTNLLLLAFTIAWIIISQRSDDFTHIENYFLVFSGLLFATLAVLLTVMGVNIARLSDADLRRLFLFERRTVTIANASIAAVFALRGVFNILSALDSNCCVVTVPLVPSEDLTRSNFFLLFLWEFVPTLVLLATIVRPPLRRCGARQSTSTRPLLWGAFSDAARSPALGSASPPQHGIPGSPARTPGGALVAGDDSSSGIAADGSSTADRAAVGGSGRGSPDAGWQRQSYLFDDPHRYDSDGEDAVPPMQHDAEQPAAVFQSQHRSSRDVVFPETFTSRDASPGGSDQQQHQQHQQQLLPVGCSVSPPTAIVPRRL